MKLDILSGDPGKTHDPFGVVGLEGTYPEKKIYIRYAKQFKKQPYEIIADKFSKLNKKIHFDMMLLEKNFDYENISNAFHRLPIKYITTSSNLTESTRAKGNTVDKPFMINWLKEQHKKNTIQYSPTRSADMEELINQQNQIVGIVSPSGYATYKAIRNRHDDLFMAKLIGCNIIRIWWDKMDDYG